MPRSRSNSPKTPDASKPERPDAYWSERPDASKPERPDEQPPNNNGGVGDKRPDDDEQKQGEMNNTQSPETFGAVKKPESPLTRSRKQSKSPDRHHDDNMPRKPRKDSKSPQRARKDSKSPHRARKDSKSPSRPRKQSKSPARKHSKSPQRKPSKSPVRHRDTSKEGRGGGRKTLYYSFVIYGVAENTAPLLKKIDGMTCIFYTYQKDKSSNKNNRIKGCLVTGNLEDAGYVKEKLEKALNKTNKNKSAKYYAYKFYDSIAGRYRSFVNDKNYCKDATYYQNGETPSEKTDDYCRQHYDCDITEDHTSNERKEAEFGSYKPEKKKPAAKKSGDKKPAKKPTKKKCDGDHKKPSHDAGDHSGIHRVPRDDKKEDEHPNKRPHENEHPDKKPHHDKDDEHHDRKPQVKRLDDNSSKDDENVHRDGETKPCVMCKHKKDDPKE